jgi:hypothetical protein
MAVTTKTPRKVAEVIGRKYVERDSLYRECHRQTERAYNRIADIVVCLYNQIPVPVVFQSDDPYTDYEDMAETVGAEQQLRVYNQHTDHPYFSHEEQCAFRAVHDWYGHLDADVDFTPEGEYRKWKHMCHHFTSNAQRRVMFAEVVGQVGAVHYLDDGFADDRYEQRVFQAPRYWIDMMTDAVEH